MVLGIVLFVSCTKSSDPNNPNNPPTTINDITITSLKPTHGPGETIDTIIGKNFDKLPSYDSVLINGTKLTILTHTAEQIIVKIPALVGTGNINVWSGGKLYQGPVFSYDSLLFVTTLAGSSSQSGYADGKGLDARFNQPHGISVDTAGNVYVADMINTSIRKITPAGDVSTLAGSPGITGDQDGIGSSAGFGTVYGLAIDATGNLYVGDESYFKVRKVTPSGLVTTVAGNIWNTGPSGGQIDGDKSVATFHSPTGVTVDANNNIYVADVYNNKIRKITPSGSVSTYAGGDYYHYGHKDGPAATSLFFTPNQVAADPFGNVYVQDAENHMIRRINKNGIVETLFGGPIEPRITGLYDVFYPTAIATDNKGNLFFAISVGIIKVTPDGTIIRYAVGGTGEIDGPAQVATYRSIRGIAIDAAGALYITDNNRVRKIAWQ